METESLADGVDVVGDISASGPAWLHICSTGAPSSLGGGSRRMGLTPAGFLTLVRDSRTSASETSRAARARLKVPGRLTSRARRARPPPARGSSS